MVQLRCLLAKIVMTFGAQFLILFPFEHHIKDLSWKLVPLLGRRSPRRFKAANHVTLSTHTNMANHITHHHKMGFDAASVEFGVNK